MSANIPTEAPKPFEPLHGECTCGNIKYEVVAPPVGKPCLCHCNNCKRQTGSMFTSNVIVLRETLNITGKYKVWSRGDDGKGWSSLFCPECGTPICSFRDDRPDKAVVRIGTLDSRDLVRLEKPVLEMFCARKIGWPADVEGAAQFEEWPTRDDLSQVDGSASIT
ncbi:hypothetical protein CALCODRAFT_481698 [Calocera cornea HHB12733]|uniref:CENP-V/GFA domain-containing protein n=1 Tax=Calocera cornea HHB12733 TaxID=1353952 RepID=A0A165HH56_9BASI|nr:hypothetical protein CALCODRAFT_481698 [Calocera cornea HHB12733]